MPGAVGVHRGQEDLPRAEPFELNRPVDRGESRGLPAAAHHHLQPISVSLGVQRGHHALAAELVGEPGDEGRVANRRGVDRDFVRSRPEHLLRVRDTADPASNSKRNEQPVCDTGHQVDERSALLVTRRDVEEHQLVRPLGVVARRLLHRIARVAQLLKPHPLHHATPRYVEARDEPPREPRSLERG